MDAHENRRWLENVELIGGEPCVNFINSVADATGPAPTEHLRSYQDLLFWLERCELAAPGESAHWIAAARSQPDAAAAALRHAQRFRDAAWRLLAAVAHRTTPAEADLAEVNKLVAKAYARMELIPRPDSFELSRHREEENLASPLWPAARSLAEFMTSERLASLRLCASDTCGWLFVDRSRTRQRRWCSMRDCGNLAKQRRHRARQTS